ncbi:putative envelope ADP TP carrier protein [Nymphaea thermarum]|nr:putative envelope ADP TP carrier protein [Nymphaea thermarum]
MREGVVQWRQIPSLRPLGYRNSESSNGEPFCLSLSSSSPEYAEVGGKDGVGGCFASLLLDKEGMKKKQEGHVVDTGSKDLPCVEQFLKHPLALLSFVPKDVALFSAGAFAGAAAKTVTAPLDRIKLLMQTHGLRIVEGSTKKGIGFLEALMMIGKEDGVKGYWKGNLPQVMRIIPYSAVQLFSYEAYKKLIKGQDKELSIAGRLVAGACAGMTATLITYPLDVLRLRLAVEPGCKTMTQVALAMLRDEGWASFYSGLGPSLLSIAPYIAVNFCIYDKSLPERYQSRPESSLATALMSASLATLMCYPLDTVRRQMQMKGSPYKNVIDAFSGILARDGVAGLYRGFVPNALKNLPNSSIRLTMFDTVKCLIESSQKEFQGLMEERNKN